MDCKHENTVTEDYLNSCKNAGCDAKHYNCGSQVRDICQDCGEIVYDSALDERLSVDPLQEQGKREASQLHIDLNRGGTQVCISGCRFYGN